MKVFANEFYAISTEEKKALDTVLNLYDRVISISETGTIEDYYENGEGKTYESKIYKTDDLLTINFKDLYKLLKDGFESYHECEF